MVIMKTLKFYRYFFFLFLFISRLLLLSSYQLFTDLRFLMHFIFCCCNLSSVISHFIPFFISISLVWFHFCCWYFYSIFCCCIFFIDLLLLICVLSFISCLLFTDLIPITVAFNNRNHTVASVGNLYSCYLLFLFVSFAVFLQ